MTVGGFRGFRGFRQLVGPGFSGTRVAFPTVSGHCFQVRVVSAKASQLQ